MSSVKNAAAPQYAKPDNVVIVPTVHTHDITIGMDKNPGLGFLASFAAVFGVPVGFAAGMFGGAAISRGSAAAAVVPLCGLLGAALTGIGIWKMTGALGTIDAIKGEAIQRGFASAQTATSSASSEIAHLSGPKKDIPSIAVYKEADGSYSTARFYQKLDGSYYRWDLGDEKFAKNIVRIVDADRKIHEVKDGKAEVEVRMWDRKTNTSKVIGDPLPYAIEFDPDEAVGAAVTANGKSAIVGALVGSYDSTAAALQSITQQDIDSIFVGTKPGFVLAHPEDDSGKVYLYESRPTGSAATPGKTLQEHVGAAIIRRTDDVNVNTVRESDKYYDDTKTRTLVVIDGTNGRGSVLKTSDWSAPVRTVNWDKSNALWDKAHIPQHSGGGQASPDYANDPVRKYYQYNLDKEKLNDTWDQIDGSIALVEQLAQNIFG